jgi:uncharacterized membrane protein YoaK (UPF0700 family)
MIKPATHETFFVGLLLSMVGGFLDAYTFVLAGGVFANAQTGNLVLLAIALLDPSSTAFLKYLFPMATFVAGIVVAELLRGHRALGKTAAWVLAVLGLEAAWLIAVGVFAAGLSVQVITCGIAFVAALQVAAFKKLGTSAYATTMITGNLRSAIEWLLHLRRDPAAWRQAAKYLAVIAGFAVGAAAGAVASMWWSWRAVYVAAALVVAVMVVVTPRSGCARVRSERN